MSLRNSYLTDTKAEADGIWETMGYNDDNTPIDFLIARRGGANKDFDKALELKTRPHRAAIDAGKMPEKLQLKLSKEVFAETVLKDWRGVQAGEWDGGKSTELVKYSPEKAVELFEILPDLYLEANAKSINRDRFLAAKKEEWGKN